MKCLVSAFAIWFAAHSTSLSETQTIIPRLGELTPVVLTVEPSDLDGDPETYTFDELFPKESGLILTSMGPWQEDRIVVPDESGLPGASYYQIDSCNFGVTCGWKRDGWGNDDFGHTKLPKDRPFFILRRSSMFSDKAVVIGGSRLEPSTTQSVTEGVNIVARPNNLPKTLGSLELGDRFGPGDRVVFYGDRFELLLEPSGDLGLMITELGYRDGEWRVTSENDQVVEAEELLLPQSFVIHYTGPAFDLSFEPTPLPEPPAILSMEGVLRPGELVEITGEGFPGFAESYAVMAMPEDSSLVTIPFSTITHSNESGRLRVVARVTGAISDAVPRRMVLAPLTSERQVGDTVVSPFMVTPEPMLDPNKFVGKLVDGMLEVTLGDTDERPFALRVVYGVTIPDSRAVYGEREVIVPDRQGAASYVEALEEVGSYFRESRHASSSSAFRLGLKDLPVTEGYLEVHYLPLPLPLDAEDGNDDGIPDTFQAEHPEYSGLWYRDEDRDGKILYFEYLLQTNPLLVDGPTDTSQLVRHENDSVSVTVRYRNPTRPLFPTMQVIGDGAWHDSRLFDPHILSMDDDGLMTILFQSPPRTAAVIPDLVVRCDLRWP